MCLFCDIAAHDEAATFVYEDEAHVAFLDNRPIFPGHTLVIPRDHHETLSDLPRRLVSPLFELVQDIAGVVEPALGAPGTFVAMNNKVSQSVPHLHVHVVPRKPKDGLRGFFWPRQRYDDEAHQEATAERLRAALAARVSG